MQNITQNKILQKTSYSIFQSRLRNLLGPMGRHTIPFGMEVVVKLENDGTKTPFLRKSTTQFQSKLPLQN